jgi:hypothetical protein
MACAMLAFALSGCDPASGPEPAATASLRIRFTHSYGASPLRFDTAGYRTPANSPVSFETLRYYVSGIRLFGMSGDTLLTSDSVFYVDGRDSSTWTHALANVPVGHIHTYGFDFGLAPARNRSGSLPNTLENLDMAWPDPMGGGYHFLKLEGRLLDSVSRPYGFYVHIGSLAVGGAVQDDHFAYEETRFPLHAALSAGDTLDLDVDMDIEAWFSGEETFDLERNAQGVMSDPSAQDLLRKNGQSGVFRTTGRRVGHAGR